VAMFFHELKKKLPFVRSWAKKIEQCSTLIKLKSSALRQICLSSTKEALYAVKTLQSRASSEYDEVDADFHEALKNELIHSVELSSKHARELYLYSSVSFVFVVENVGMLQHVLNTLKFIMKCNLEYRLAELTLTASRGVSEEEIIGSHQFVEIANLIKEMTEKSLFRPDFKLEFNLKGTRFVIENNSKPLISTLTSSSINQSNPHSRLVLRIHRNESMPSFKLLKHFDYIPNYFIYIPQLSKSFALYFRRLIEETSSTALNIYFYYKGYGSHAELAQLLHVLAQIKQVSELQLTVLSPGLGIVHEELEKYFKVELPTGNFSSHRYLLKENGRVMYPHESQ
jgi:hypothetical protein